jgi:hypothetical protein
MSRRPGIGRDWIDLYLDDVYPHDYVVVNGKKVRPPKFYDSVLMLERPYEFDEVKDNRELSGKIFIDNNTPERLQVREAVQQARLNRLTRGLDSEI